MAEEVVCLGFMLDIGNIKEPLDSQYRNNLIYSMYAQNTYGKSQEMDEELKLTGEVYLNELLGQFTRNYTQTTKRGLLTTNKG